MTNLNNHLQKGDADDVADYLATHSVSQKELQLAIINALRRTAKTEQRVRRLDMEMERNQS